MDKYLIFLPVVPLFFYFFLLVRKIFRKEWINNRYLLSSLKYIIFIPFWIAYIYFILPFAFPQLSKPFEPNYVAQKIEIKNTEKKPREVFLAKRIYRTNTWQPAYPVEFLSHTSPFVSLKPQETKELTLRAGASYADILLFIDKPLNKSEKLNAIAITLPRQTFKLYTHEFDREHAIKKIPISASREILLFLLSLTAVFGILYHVFSTRAKKTLAFAINFIYAVVLLLSGYLAWTLAITLLYLLF